MRADHDNGGVHVNSGIPNRAFYVTAFNIGGSAWEKAGQIWYVTLKSKLLASADFATAAAKTYEAARDLYGQGSLEQQAVKAGWAEVGIDVEQSTPPDPGTRPGCATTLTSLARSLFGSGG